MKRIIWVIGSMASGKSTQARKLMDFFGGEFSIEQYQGTTDGKNWMFSNKGDCCYIGQYKEGVATSGIDPVMSKLKVEGIGESIKQAYNFPDSSIIIVEGAQAAITWLDLIQKYDKDFVLVHLNLSYEDNARRLKKRQFIKQFPEEYQKINGTEKLEDTASLRIKLSDKNYESIFGKNKQYSNLFAKINDKTPNSVQIDSTKPISEILEQILETVNNSL